MCTTLYAPGAAKYLLNLSSTEADASINTQSKQAVLVRAPSLITAISQQIAHPDKSDKVQYQFLLQQCRGIEEMLVERGVSSAGITTFL
jgi:hypothetical protein